jgi:hypothetical protein
MQPCEELKNLVFKPYGKFTSDGLIEPIRETYSFQESVTIIGNNPDEWYADRESVLAFIQTGSGSKLEIEKECDHSDLGRREVSGDGTRRINLSRMWI